MGVSLSFSVSLISPPCCLIDRSLDLLLDLSLFVYFLSPMFVLVELMVSEFASPLCPGYVPEQQAPYSGSVRGGFLSGPLKEP